MKPVSKGDALVSSLWPRIVAALRLPLGIVGPRGLILLVLVAGGIWAFVWLAEEVVEGDTHAVDQAILKVLRNPDDSADPLGPAWLEESVRDLTALGSFSVLGYLTAGAAGLLLIQGKRRTAALLLGSIVGAVLFSIALKLGFERPRPEVVAHISKVTTSSFPSQHSLMSVVVYLTLGALLAQTQQSRRLKAYLIFLAVVTALLVGFSRLYLGVHWPSDVLAGWAVGGAWALLSWFVLLRLQQRGDVAPETPTVEDGGEPESAPGLPHHQVGKERTSRKGSGR